MKVLTFRDASGDVNVRYKCDMMNDTDGNLVVLETDGLDELAQREGMDFQQLPHHIDSFKDFAASNNLSLSIENSDGSNFSFLAEIDYSHSISLSL